MTTRHILLVAGFGLLATTTLHALEAVGWHYHSGGPENALSPDEVAGPSSFAQKNWNNHASRGQAPGVVPFPLNDNEGNATGIELTAWSHSANHSASHGTKGTLTPDEKLLERFARKNASLTFSGIPEPYIKGGYTVVVYYTTNSPRKEATLQIEGSGNDFATRKILSGGAKENPVRAGGFVEERGKLEGVSNYTVFTRLNDPEFTLSFVDDSPAGLSAVQIIAEKGPPFRESTTPAIAANPPDGASEAKPWQPISWKSGGEGESRYDLYLWQEGESPPRSPVATVKKPIFTPSSYMLPRQNFRWRVITHTESGKKLVSPEFKFTTGDLTGQPPFDVSPKGHETRAATLESLKGIQRLVTKGSEGYPLADKTTLAFYGDSITDVSEYFKDIATALKKAKNQPGFPEIKVLNRGINGGTSDDLLTLSRGDRWKGGTGPNPPKPFKKQVDEDLAALPPGGTYVAVIQIGINDASHRDKTPPNLYKERLSEMVAHVLSKGQKVVLVSPSAFQESPIADIVDDGQFDDAVNALLNDYAGALAEIAKEKNLAFVNQRQAYLDYYRNHNVKVAADGSVTFPKKTGILNGDGVHPNMDGRLLSAELVALGIYETALQPTRK
jgi:lysophospholipase L1-like esterase